METDNEDEKKKKKKGTLTYSLNNFEQPHKKKQHFDINVSKIMLTFIANLAGTRICSLSTI